MSGKSVKSQIQQLLYNFIGSDASQYASCMIFAVM